MRADHQLSNGNSHHSANGSASNGALYSSGDATASSSKFMPLYPDSSIDRREFVRLTLQALKDAGLSYASHSSCYGYPPCVHSETARTLSSESGIEAESDQIQEFRQAVLEGRWSELEQLLNQIDPEFANHQQVCRQSCNQPSLLVVDSRYHSNRNIVF